MKTYSAKPTDVTRVWHVIDASEASFGRLASVAATLLLGKHKPMFTKHIDCGDYVIIINAAQMKVTGEKQTDKLYHHYSGFPSGLKTATLKDVVAKDPGEPLRHAIRGMLPVNKLRDERLKRLKIYEGSEHQHDAQKPQPFSVKDKI